MNVHSALDLSHGCIAEQPISASILLDMLESQPTLLDDQQQKRYSRARRLRINSRIIRPKQYWPPSESQIISVESQSSQEKNWKPQHSDSPEKEMVEFEFDNENTPPRHANLDFSTIKHPTSETTKWKTPERRKHMVNRKDLSFILETQDENPGDRQFVKRTNKTQQVPPLRLKDQENKICGKTDTKKQMKIDQMFAAIGRRKDERGNQKIIEKKELKKKENQLESNKPQGTSKVVTAHNFDKGIPPNPRSDKTLVQSKSTRKDCTLKRIRSPNTSPSLIGTHSKKEKFNKKDVELQNPPIEDTLHSLRQDTVEEVKCDMDSPMLHSPSIATPRHNINQNIHHDSDETQISPDMTQIGTSPNIQKGHSKCSSVVEPSYDLLLSLAPDERREDKLEGLIENNTLEKGTSVIDEHYKTPIVNRRRANRDARLMERIFNPEAHVEYKFDKQGIALLEIPKAQTPNLQGSIRVLNEDVPNQSLADSLMLRFYGQSALDDILERVNTNSEVTSQLNNQQQATVEMDHAQYHQGHTVQPSQLLDDDSPIVQATEDYFALDDIEKTPSTLTIDGRPTQEASPNLLSPCTLQNTEQQEQYHLAGVDLVSQNLLSQSCHSNFSHEQRSLLEDETQLENGKYQEEQSISPNLDTFNALVDQVNREEDESTQETQLFRALITGSQSHIDELL